MADRNRRRNRSSKKEKKEKKPLAELTGKAQMTREGFIFVIAEGEDSDVFVKASKTKGALNGDIVKVAVTKEKTDKQRREGVVTEILQDNLQPDGTRVGEQRVRVQMTTGVRAGETIEMTSASGYLFGAPCTVGMKVIVMQSVAGDSTVASVYAQDREMVIYVFGALYLMRTEDF